MKVSDQGFTERISSQTTQTSSTSKSSSSSATQRSSQSSPDNLQLSNIASRLQGASSFDAGRAQRLSQISNAVSSSTYQIDPSKISGALISEALQSSAR